MTKGPIEIRNLLAGKLRAAINFYAAIVLERPGELESHLAATLDSLAKTGLGEPPPGYAYSRKLYRSLRIDPTRYRPASEALWRRFRDCGDLPRRNPLVDLTNLLSLLFQVSYGLYDADRIAGPVVTIGLGAEGDSYPGIGREMLQLSGKIVLKDARGAFGNPSSDSQRTAVGPETRNVLQVIFFHPEDPAWEEIQAETVRTMRMFASWEKAEAWTT